MINIQNADDNECVKFCLVRYLNPADHNPRRSMKLDKYFVKRLDFKDISNQKLEIFTKLKKKNSIDSSVFGYYFNRFMYDHSLHRRRNHFVVIVYMISLEKKY